MIFSECQRKGVFWMTFYSEIWGETEKPGRMMGTQPLIRDDHPGGEMTKYSFL